MSPAMIVLAGSSVVGATLRANTTSPPFLGVPDAELVLLDADEELPPLEDPPHAASTALRPNAAAPPWPPVPRCSPSAARADGSDWSPWGRPPVPLPQR